MSTASLPDQTIEVGVRFTVAMELNDGADASRWVCTLSWPTTRAWVVYAGGLLDTSTVCESCGTPVACSPWLDAVGHPVPTGAWWEMPRECWEEDDPGGDIDLLIMEHSPALCRASRVGAADRADLVERAR